MEKSILEFLRSFEALFVVCFVITTALSGYCWAKSQQGNYKQGKLLTLTLALSTIGLLIVILIIHRFILGTNGPQITIPINVVEAMYITFGPLFVFFFIKYTPALNPDDPEYPFKIALAYSIGSIGLIAISTFMSLFLFA